MLDSILGPDAIEWNGTHYKTILSAKETAGSMSIVDSVSPAGSGPPRHVHHDCDETFVVLTGECEVWIEGKSRTVGPGQTAFIPRGRQHTFQILGDMPSRHLVILSPGGFEAFFDDMAAGQYQIPAQMEEIVAIAAKHHLEFTGPPLGAE